MGGVVQKFQDDHMPFEQFYSLNEEFFKRGEVLAARMEHSPPAHPPRFLSVLNCYYAGEGPAQMKLPNGRGRIYSEEYFYSGSVVLGLPEGQGFFLYKDGVTYTGEVVRGQRHGVGVLTDEAHKKYYQGQWSMNLKSGKGFQKNGNGSCFEGVFKDNQMREGELFHFNKRLMNFGNQDPHSLLGYLRAHPACEKYKGEFCKGLYHGVGEYTWEDGKRYVGNWAEGMMHGQGQFFWPDGKYYYGEYFRDQKQGQGIMVWNQEKLFEGMFDKGRPHGFGCLLLDGAIKYGVWENGNFMSSIKGSYSRDKADKIKSGFVLSRAVKPLKKQLFQYREVQSKKYFQSGKFKAAVDMARNERNSVSLDAASMVSRNSKLDLQINQLPDLPIQLHNATNLTDYSSQPLFCCYFQSHVNDPIYF